MNGDSHVVSHVDPWPELAVPGGVVMAVVLLALAIALVGLELWRTRGGAPHRPARIALRSLTALAALLVATQPRWVVERIDEREGRVAVLVDGSRSMEVGQRRATVRSLLERWEGDVDDATLQRFGSELQAGSFDDLDALTRPRDDETRIGAALREVIDADAAGRVGAIVVVSDGAESDPLEPAREVEALGGVRVHAVHVGAEDTLRDDGLASLRADALGFLRSPAEVKVTVRTSGLGARTLPVTLFEGNEVVHEEIVELDEGEAREVVLPFVPRRLGRAVYRVVIPTDDEDDVPANNERAFLLQVQRDRLRVLLVAGHPTWDVRFLRSFLERDPSIDLISFFILRTTSDLTMAPPDQLALIPFPTDELFREHLGSFDVVVFQDFDYAPYGMASYLPRIRSYVERGGSFAMIGGEKSFASGGYAGTPIADVLPVELPRVAAPEPGLDERLVVLGEFAPRIEGEYVFHPLVALGADPDASREAWSRLAALEGANRLDGAREGASVLLTHPRARTRRGQPLPILATGEFGEGRVMALASDTSWKWGLPSGGRSGDASAHERFWDRSLRWLARDPTLEPAHVTTDRERYGPEAVIRVRAELRDDRYRPLALQPVVIALEDASGAVRDQARLVLDASGHGEVELTGPDTSGAYRVVARAAESASDDAIAEQWFVVEAGGEELADPRARPEHLAAWAEASGGQVHAAGDAPALDQFDTTRTEHLGTTTRAPFASVWALIGVTLLLGAEWWWRRRHGLR